MTCDPIAVRRVAPAPASSVLQAATRPTWTIVLLVASACVSHEPTPRKLGLDLPAEWSAAGDGVSAAPIEKNWWRAFGDPRLDAHVERAFAFNRDLAAASARLARAVATARVAGAELGPSVDLGFDAGRQRQNFIGLPIPGRTDEVLSTTTSTFGLGLSVSWEIDLWGRLRAADQRARRDLEAAAADLHGARLSLAGQVTKGWFAWLEARAQRTLAERTAELFASSADRIRARFERGTRPSLDVRLAETELANARADLALREETLDRSGRALQILLGRYPDGAIEGDADLPALPGQVPAGLPAHIVHRRPDLAAAERRLAAADAGVTEARADLYPQLRLTAGGGTRSDDIGDLLDGDFRVWSWAGNLVAPLFDNGRRRARVEVRDASRLEAYATWAGAVLDALGEVETALAAEELLAEQARHVADATLAATAARELSEDRYARGLIDVVTLITAQRREVAARSRQLALQRQRLATRVDLLLALGGGFGTAEPPTDDTSAAAPADPDIPPRRP